MQVHMMLLPTRTLFETKLPESKFHVEADDCCKYEPDDWLANGWRDTNISLRSLCRSDYCHGLSDVVADAVADAVANDGRTDIFRQRIHRGPAKIAMKDSVASGMASITNVATSAVSVKLGAGSVKVVVYIRAAANVNAIHIKLTESNSTLRPTIAANVSLRIGLPSGGEIFSLILRSLCRSGYCHGLSDVVADAVADDVCTDGFANLFTGAPASLAEWLPPRTSQPVPQVLCSVRGPRRLMQADVLCQRERYSDRAGRIKSHVEVNDCCQYEPDDRVANGWRNIYLSQVVTPIRLVSRSGGPHQPRSRSCTLRWADDQTDGRADEQPDGRAFEQEWAIGASLTGWSHLLRHQRWRQWRHPLRLRHQLRRR